MQTAKLQKSKAYAQFRANDVQRQLNSLHCKRIAQSIKTHGFIPSKPIQVYKNGSGFVIVDGHHRFDAAKSVGAEFYYVVEDKAAQHVMVDENRLVKTWGLVDYVRLYAAQGSEDYREILKFAAKGIPMTRAASLLWGDSAGSGNAQKAIKQGTFYVKDRVSITKIVAAVAEFGPKNPAAKSNHFIDALSKCLLTPEVDWDVLIKRLRDNLTMVERVNNLPQMLQQFEGVYNFRSRSPIPLAWAVGNAMRSRNVVLVAADKKKGGRK